MTDTDCVPPVLDKPAYDASVTFPDSGMLMDTRMGIAWDGTNYWAFSGGSPSGNTLAQYSAAGAFVNVYQAPVDFRSVFTVGGNGTTVYGRGYSDSNLLKMTSPGAFTQTGVVLSGGMLDAQSNLVFNPAGTELVAMANGNVDRWTTAGTHIQSFMLQGLGSMDPNENIYPQNRGIVVIGDYYLTYYNQKLTAWDSNGVRIKSSTLNGAGTTFDSYFSLSYANGMVWIVDGPNLTWRGYNVGQ
jgi:hypothetical protein